MQTMAEAADGTLWCVPTPAALRWRDWGDELVVHDADSSSAHLLEPGVGSVLLALLAHVDGIGQQALGKILYPAAADNAQWPSDQDGAAEALEDHNELSRILVSLQELGLAVPVAR